LRRLADGGKGIVMVMHDLPLALDFSDSIIIIKNGEVAAHASPAKISSSPLIREIFGVAVEKTENGKFYYNY
jgi:iron complex transport system ATP-binding protein